MDKKKIREIFEKIIVNGILILCFVGWQIFIIMFIYDTATGRYVPSPDMDLPIAFAGGIEILMLFFLMLCLQSYWKERKKKKRTNKKKRK